MCYGNVAMESNAIWHDNMIQIVVYTNTQNSYIRR